MKKISLIVFILATSSLSFANITLYTDRSVDFVQPVADVFEARTGVKVDIVSANYSQLSKRLDAEGVNTRADLIFVKDMVYLNELSKKGLFQPMQTNQPEALVATAMRHPENLWTAVTIRPRTLVYNKAKVPSSDLSEYSDLADPRWSKKLCLRTSNSSYNVALVSSLIHHRGYEAAKTLVQAWVENLSQVPFRNDRSVLDAIAEGACDVGLVNSYYLAGKIKADENFPVGLAFANQKTSGVHVNGTGVGVSVHSKNIKEANAFIDLLLSDESQVHLSSSHLDYPAKLGLLPETFVKDWGVFKAEEVNWSVLGLQHRNAERLFEEVGYL